MFFSWSSHQTTFIGMNSAHHSRHWNIVHSFLDVNLGSSGTLGFPKEQPKKAGWEMCKVTRQWLLHSKGKAFISEFALHQLPPSTSIYLTSIRKSVRWKEAKGIHSNCKTTLVSVIDGAMVRAINTRVSTNTVFPNTGTLWKILGEFFHDSQTVLSTVLYQEVCHLSIV